MGFLRALSVRRRNILCDVCASSEYTANGRQPVLGPLAKQAMRVPLEGAKRRKLLVLLAAYADAGIHDPSLRELHRRLGFKDWRAVLELALRLRKDGYIAFKIHKGERNVYRLRCLEASEEHQAHAA